MIDFGMAVEFNNLLIDSLKSNCYSSATAFSSFVDCRWEIADFLQYLNGIPIEFLEFIYLPHVIKLQSNPMTSSKKVFKVWGRLAEVDSKLNTLILSWTTTLNLASIALSFSTFLLPNLQDSNNPFEISSQAFSSRLCL